MTFQEHENVQSRLQRLMMVNTTPQLVLPPDIPLLQAQQELNHSIANSGLYSTHRSAGRVRRVSQAINAVCRLQGRWSPPALLYIQNPALPHLVRSTRSLTLTVRTLSA